MSTVKIEDLKKVLIEFEDDLYNDLEKLNSKRLGLILTVIDGAISNDIQRKAIKDLIKINFYNAKNTMPTDLVPEVEEIAHTFSFSLYGEDEGIPYKTRYTSLIEN